MGGPSDDVTTGAATGLPGGPNVFGVRASGTAAPIPAVAPPGFLFKISASPLNALEGGGPNSVTGVPVSTVDLPGSATGGAGGATASGNSGAFAGTGAVAFGSTGGSLLSGKPGYGAGSGGAASASVAAQSSGSVLRVVIGVVLIAAAVFIAYGQIKRHRAGAL
ncbi:hypothetical protein H0A66_16630 [Alcaligenaceae bacterium]|nr:hypothetical protein [Alcaligenaceae bacterium]